MTIIKKSKNSQSKKVEKISQDFYNKESKITIKLNTRRIKQDFINLDSFYAFYNIEKDLLDSMLGMCKCSINDLHPTILAFYNSGYITIEFTQRIAHKNSNNKRFTKTRQKTKPHISWKQKKQKAKKLLKTYCK